LNYSCKILCSFKQKFYYIFLFSYFGHGSGSLYYDDNLIENFKFFKACSILMGCSSGNQYSVGEFEPYGTIFSYILAGCPLVVGNLWDLTRSVFDRTRDLLKSWILRMMIHQIFVCI
jgi:separase